MSKKALNVQDDSRRKGIQGNTSKSEIKCVCLYARSIINKKTELNIMVDDIKPHIIGITESWANNDITNAELGLEGYVMFRKDRIGRRGGGVLLYIKDTIPAYEVQLQAAFLMVILDTTAEEEESSATKKGLENSTDENQIGGWVGQEGERRKSYSAAVIDGIKRNSRIYVGDSIVRKTDTRLSKEEDVVVCLPGARIEHVTERVEKIMGRGKGGTILVHIGTNNADKEGTTAIVDKYRKLLKKTKEARVEQIILSGILPVFGNRLDGYRNSKRMAINGMVKRLCKEEDVGYVDLWDSFVGKEEMYVRDGLHLSGKGAAVFAEGLSGAVASGLGKVRYLN